MSLQNLEVDLDLKQNLNVYATCKQLDNLNLICNIFDNSVQADLTNYNVKLRAMKADKVPLIQDTNISISNNVVIIEASEQLSTTSGKTLVELQFIDKISGLKKATFNLILTIVSSVIEVNASISTATYTLLQELENKLEQASDFFENIDKAVEANSTLETTINNSKTAKSNLDKSISTGNTLKSGLDSDISIGETLKDNLDSDISTGTTLKTGLETTIDNANEVKQELDTFVSEHSDVIDLDDRVKANAQQINKLNNEKASTIYVDSKFANILNGNPKGTYATLALLQAAFPTGTTGIYIVTADGKWYYWNTTLSTPAWTAGGTYQSTGIGDGTITKSMLEAGFSDEYNKIKNGIMSANIRDIFPVSKGYVKISDYTIVDNDPNYVYTDLLLVKGGSTITYSYRAVNTVSVITFYDSSKNVISGTTSSYSSGDSIMAGTITVPLEAKYVRLCWAERYNTADGAGKGTYGDSNFVIQYAISDRFSQEDSKIEDVKSFFISQTDLSSLVTYAGYLGITGIVANTTDTNWFYSDYIKVESYDVIRINLLGHTAVGSVCFYDSSKVFISAVVANSNGVPIAKDVTVPSNSAYVRLTFSSYSNAKFTNSAFKIVNEIEELQNKSEMAEQNIAANKTDIATNKTDIKNTNTRIDGFIDLCKVKTYIGYIGTSGVISNGIDNNWRYTDYLKVTAGTTIQANINAHTTINGISFYDTNKAYISGVSGVTISGLITIPSNTCYVRLSFSSPSFSGKTSSAIYSDDVNNSVSNIRANVDIIDERVTNVENTLWTSKNLMPLMNNIGYINPSGVVNSTSDVNWKYSDYIEVKSTDKIKYKLQGHTLIGTVCFYDKDKRFISSVVATDSNMWVEKTTSVPATACYIRITKNVSGSVETYETAVCLSSFVEEQKIFNGQFTITKDLADLAVHYGYLGVDGQVSNSNDNHWVYSDFIELDSSVVINYDLIGHSIIGSINFYDSSKTFISGVGGTGTGTTQLHLTGTVTSPSNTKYVRVSFGEKSYVNYISTLKYNTTLIREVDKAQEDIFNLKSILGSKDVIDYEPPYKIYTTCNDIVSTDKWFGRNYASAIYLDHLFNGLTEEKDIRFDNGLDRIVFTSPMKVIDANEFAPTVTYNEGVNIYEETKTVGVQGNDIEDTTFDITHVSTLNSVTKDVTPRVLCIGDSITYAEQATINDDYHTQNWAYHLMCKQFFMKDNIDYGSGFDCRFLGHYKKTRTFNYKGVDRQVVTYHEGIRGISMTQYLTGQVSAFKSDATGKFSLNAWLNQYRTLDDMGARLTVGNGTGSLITASNINDIDVCTPTHVLIALGANGGYTKAQLDEMISIIHTEYPNMIIGIVILDSAGTYFPSLHPKCGKEMAIWNDSQSRHSQQYNLNKLVQINYANATNESNKIFYIPFFYVAPSAESGSMRRVNFPDSEIELMNDNLYNELFGWYGNTHVNGIGHVNWGYQLYSWLKYTIAKTMLS